MSFCNEKAFWKKRIFLNVFRLKKIIPTVAGSMLPELTRKILLSAIEPRLDRYIVSSRK